MYTSTIAFWCFLSILRKAEGNADESLVSKYLNDPETSSEDLCDVVGAMYGGEHHSLVTVISNPGI